LFRKRQTLDYDDAEEVDYKETDDGDSKDKDDDAPADDDDAALGLGTVVYEDDSAFAAYDYSHLLPVGTEDDPSSDSSPSDASSSRLTVTAGLPETDRVVQRPPAPPPAAKSAAVMAPPGDSSAAQRLLSATPSAAGRIAFVCRLGLTVDEAAVITVKSRLYAASLSGELYAGVSQFSVTSAAEVAPHELVEVTGPLTAEATSVLDVTEPVYTQGLLS
jgi:hypothetical protein